MTHDNPTDEIEKHLLKRLNYVWQRCDSALRDRLRPILRRILTEASLAGRTVTTITPYTHATETFIAALGEVSSLARCLYEDQAAPEQRTTWWQDHVRQVEIMNECVEAFQQQPEVRSVWGRGVRTARMEKFLEFSDLLTRALREKGKLKERIRQAQREMLARLTFVDEWHMPTITAIEGELVRVLGEWKKERKTKTAPYGFRWKAGLDLDHAERPGEKEVYKPGPTEIAQRLIGLVAHTSWGRTSWKTVEKAVGEFRREETRRRE